MYWTLVYTLIVILLLQYILGIQMFVDNNNNINNNVYFIYHRF